MNKLAEYLQLSREERTAHVDLSTACVLDGVKGGARQKAGRKALLTLLGVEDDVADWRTEKVCCAHLCGHHSKNGWCTNPLHLYVGTVWENAHDTPEVVRKERSRKASEATHREKDENGKSVNGVKAAERLHREKNEEGKSDTAVKAGEAATREKNEEGKSVNAVKNGKKGGKKGAKTTNSHLWVSLHDGFVGNVGNVAYHNEVVGAEREYRVQLAKDEVESYSPLFESFEYTTFRSSGAAVKRTGRRVPEPAVEELRER